MDFSSDALGLQYLEFCNLRNSAIIAGTIDLTSVSWFYPTLLLPLAIFCQENPDVKIYEPINHRSSSYFSFIKRGDNSLSDTSLPIKKIPNDRRENVIDRLCDIENGDCIGNTDAFMYMVMELVANVYDHSNFSNAYIMAQKYPSKKFLDISIIDNGLSIPQSLEKAGYGFEDPEAIWQAVINGLSTKQDSARGYGLRTSIKLLREGLNGQCLIVSRNGSFIGGRGENLYKMGASYEFLGTLISIRIPFRKNKVNIYEFVDI